MMTPVPCFTPLRSRLHPRHLQIIFGLLLAIAAGLLPANGQPPVTQGLVLHLESDQGVTVNSGRVTTWSDLSGRGNHLHAIGAPVLKTAATPSGRPAIALDAIDDLLEREHTTHALTGLPMANRDRTVLFVVRYQAAKKWGGLVWGLGNANQAYGVAINPNTGTLAVQGWGRGNDYTSSTSALGQGWMLQTTVHAAGRSTLHEDGRSILSFTHSYDTQLGRLVIGEEIASLGSVGLDVAAALVYDRALTATERQSVEAYLQQKYLLATPQNVAPSLTLSAPAANTSVAAGQPLGLSATASDPEDGSLSGSIEWTSSLAGALGRGGQLSVTLAEGVHTLTASVSDSRGATSRAQVTVTVTPEPAEEPAPGTEEPPVEEDPIEPAPAPAPTPRIVKLFDGQSLNGVYVWSMSEGRDPSASIFTVKDGLLRVASDERYAALVSENEYSNYIMTMEFKWGTATYGHRAGKARDAGIMVHSHGPDGGWKGRLMANLEVQVLEGGMGDLMMLRGADPMRMSIPCVQGKCLNRTWYCRGEYRWNPQGTTRKTFYGTSDYAETVHWYGWDHGFKDVAGFRGRNDIEKPRGQWNQFVIVCDDDRIEVYFNGVKVNEAFNLIPSKGRVQLESEMAEYYVRRWEIELLD